VPGFGRSARRPRIGSRKLLAAARDAAADEVAHLQRPANSLVVLLVRIAASVLSRETTRDQVNTPAG
jgi:hypothetical protein